MDGRRSASGLSPRRRSRDAPSERTSQATARATTIARMITMRPRRGRSSFVVMSTRLRDVVTRRRFDFGHPRPFFWSPGHVPVQVVKACRLMTRAGRGFLRAYPAPWRGDTIPHHRRRTGRQHRCVVRRPSRCQGDRGRTGGRRRRRPPARLHPVEDDDRHRWGDELPAPLHRHGSRAGLGDRRHRGVDDAHRGHQTPPPDRHERPVAEPGRAPDQRHGPLRSHRTLPRSTRSTARNWSTSTSPSSPPAHGRASPTGASLTVIASSRPATAIRRRSSRPASRSSDPASPASSSCTCSPRSVPT